jgi:nitrite reductase (NO-forming)
MGRMDLPVAADPTPTACCAACATNSTPVVGPRPLPVIDMSTTVRVAPRPSRDADRRITLASVAVAGGFLAAGLASAVVDALAGGARPGWLPLHLVLAGAGGTAIAGVLPFFAAALAAGPAANPRARVAAVALVAVGSALVAGRAVGAAGWVPPVGGALFVVGIAIVALIGGRSMRGGLATRRPLVALAYAVALLNVMVGASLATLSLAGLTSFAELWAFLRPAHAWLNVIGFVSLVVAGTLLHLLPTVAGTRIVEGRVAKLAIGSLAVGPPLVAAGMLAAGVSWAEPLARPLALVGALLSMGAGIALFAESASILRRRGRWTTDHSWHRMSTWSIGAATAWFAVGVGIAGLRVIALGPVPAAWDSALVAAPLVVGWVVQVLIGAWTHLVPAIGPGGASGHAARRAILGRWAAVRVIALDAGVACLTVGLGLAAPQFAVVGAVLVAGALVANLGLALASVVVRPAPLP